VKIGEVFEEALGEIVNISSESLENVAENSDKRQSLIYNVLRKLEPHFDELVKPMGHLIDLEIGAGLLNFCTVTVDAFFDNDLFMTTKTFLRNAKGSFGLCVTSSLDAHRQICLAARGQTVSVKIILFFPP
jgi:phage-related protein